MMHKKLAMLMLTTLILGTACTSQNAEQPTQPQPVAPTSAVEGQAKPPTNKGTTLKITNNSPTAVPVLITLGNSSNPATNFGISNINQLPKEWNIQPNFSAPTTQGSFVLNANSSVSFNSGSKSFSGNVAFGPGFTARGCGSSSKNACYPNATNLGEFTLNIAGGTETVDISDVNGANANLTINFSGQNSSNLWNSGSYPNANSNVTTISATPLISKLDNKQIGVFGWQATNCINVVPPIPNPTKNCPKPLDAPKKAQLAPNAQCNIQRGQNAPTGGTVEIVFSGYMPNSAPKVGCATVHSITPATGSKKGGTTVTLNGWGFDAVTKVTFQGAKATQLVKSQQSLTFVTPACNFCSGKKPWYSNVVLHFSNGTSYILPAYTAGADAKAAYQYTK
ncbi:MAG TPA: IPT/TIG domain-containing protein [Pseudomonadales bacterium]|nr:IPT/TIG domain-containing protein [Pseudomonadales bacterium]